MNHLNNAQTSSKIPAQFFCYFESKFVDLEPFLSSDGKVWLVLIKTDMNYFLFLVLH